MSSQKERLDGKGTTRLLFTILRRSLHQFIHNPKAGGRRRDFLRPDGTPREKWRAASPHLPGTSPLPSSTLLWMSRACRHAARMADVDVWHRRQAVPAVAA